MSTKVKVGIASVIVAALVALIVLDQKTTPKDDLSKSGPSAESPTGNTSDDQIFQERQRQVNQLIDKSEKQFGGTKPGHPPPPKGVDPSPGKDPKPAGGEEYVIQPGDTFDSIAQKKLGDRKYAKLIAEANPSVKPNALRPGKHLTIPPKPEEKEIVKDPPAPKDPPKDGPKPASPDPGVTTVGNKKVYVVQQGDSLSQISTKVYGTMRYVDKIFEANRDQLDSPDMLRVGIKLVMPDVPVKKSEPAGAGTTHTSAPAPAGKKTHQVESGDNLWKIAEKYAGEKGVYKMIQAIVEANGEKLKDGDRTLLRLGWQLIIPE